MAKAKKYMIMDSTLCSWAIEEGWEDTRNSLDVLANYGTLGIIPVGDLDPWMVGQEVIKNYTFRFLNYLPIEARQFLIRALDAVDREVVGSYVITYAKGGREERT